MARKRISRNIARNRIVPAAVAAYREGDVDALRRALCLPPWQASPLHAAGPCPWPSGSAGALTWPDSVRLREALPCAV